MRSTTPSETKQIYKELVTPAKAGVSGNRIPTLEMSAGLNMPRMFKDCPGDNPTLRSFAGMTVEDDIGGLAQFSCQLAPFGDGHRFGPPVSGHTDCIQSSQCPWYRLQTLP
jgi:FAD/FMN-containing dehydrogenase